MEVTKELIQKELDKLIGKEVCSWGPSPVFDTVKRLLKENGYPFDYLSWSYSRQDITISWRGYMICCISYKKKMGPKKQHYWEDQKYTYKEFTVSFPWEINTLNQSIKNATKSYNEQVEKTNKELERDKEAFKLLKEHFNIERDWDVRDLANSISRNYYKITEK
jgi:hypothetical protein